MSNALLNAVWSHSAAKGGDLLVLLAIADRARDDGTAFPSLSDIAQRARLSRRNARRAIAHLERDGELQVDRGGGRVNNRYRILIGGNVAEAKLTRANLSPQPGHFVPSAGALASPQQGRGNPRSSTRLPRNDEPEPTYNHHSTHNPVVVADDLVWPEALTSQDREAIGTSLRKHGIDTATAQSVLDELSSAIGEKRITRSPVGYARALIVLAARGEFVPEHARRVRGARETRGRAVAATLDAKIASATPATRDSALQHLRALMQKSGKALQQVKKQERRCA